MNRRFWSKVVGPRSVDWGSRSERAPVGHSERGKDPPVGHHPPPPPLSDPWRGRFGRDLTASDARGFHCVPPRSCTRLRPFRRVPPKAGTLTQAPAETHRRKDMYTHAQSPTDPPYLSPVARTTWGLSPWSSPKKRQRKTTPATNYTMIHAHLPLRPLNTHNSSHVSRRTLRDVGAEPRDFSVRNSQNRGEGGGPFSLLTLVNLVWR